MLPKQLIEFAEIAQIVIKCKLKFLKNIRNKFLKIWEYAIIDEQNNVNILACHALYIKVFETTKKFALRRLRTFYRFAVSQH